MELFVDGETHIVPDGTKVYYRGSGDPVESGVTYLYKYSGGWGLYAAWHVATHEGQPLRDHVDQALVTPLKGHVTVEFAKRLREEDASLTELSQQLEAAGQESAEAYRKKSSRFTTVGLLTVATVGIGGAFAGSAAAAGGVGSGAATAGAGAAALGSGATAAAVTGTAAAVGSAGASLLDSATKFVGNLAKAAIGSALSPAEPETVPGNAPGTAAAIAAMSATQAPRRKGLFELIGEFIYGLLK